MKPNHREETKAISQLLVLVLPPPPPPPPLICVCNNSPKVVNDQGLGTT